MPARDPHLRQTYARLGAHSLHAGITDERAHTAPARAASPSAVEWHERQLDPDGILDPAVRRRRAEHARHVYFLRLALRSAQARRRTA